MKKAIGVFFSLCILSIAGMANAIPVTGTYGEISEPNIGVYTHTVTFDLEADSEAHATLRLTFAGTNSNETWEIYEVINKETGALGDVRIGVLENSNNNIYQEFDLSDLRSFQSAVSGSSWTFSFTFLETNKKNRLDSFSLASSEISVYTDPIMAVDPIIRTESLPAPEPGTIILVGSGLIGLVVINRRKFSK